MIKDYNFTVEELFYAYYDCRKHKRNKRYALEFERELEMNLMDLYYELESGEWNPSPATVFVITHPKPREVWAADFRDRIVHHLIYRAIGGYFEKRFIYDSCACIKGKGTLFAVNRLKKHLLSSTENWTIPKYYLKCDVRNFFSSIDQNILFEQLKAKVDNPFLLNLIEKIIFQEVTKNAKINSSEELLKVVPRHKSLFNVEKGKGLPIGNLSSQFFANVYLDDFDQYVKREMKIKNYVRYVDDFILINEKEEVKFNLEEIKKRLKILGLELADQKTIINKADSGIDFVGTIIRPYRNQTRPKTFKYALHKLKCQEDIYNSINSYLGLFKHSGNKKERIKIAKIGIAKGFGVDVNISKIYKSC